MYVTVSLSVCVCYAINLMRSSFRNKVSNVIFIIVAYHPHFPGFLLFAVFKHSSVRERARARLSLCVYGRVVVCICDCWVLGPE